MQVVAPLFASLIFRVLEHLLDADDVYKFRAALSEFSQSLAPNTMNSFTKFVENKIKRDENLARDLALLRSNLLETACDSSSISICVRMRLLVRLSNPNHFIGKVRCVNLLDNDNDVLAFTSLHDLVQTLKVFRVEFSFCV
jgi:hypothetical protein